MRKDYYKTVRFPDGHTKTYFPPMFYSYNPEGDVTFMCRARNLGERNLPRKIKKWMRKEMGWGRWEPFWTGLDRKPVVELSPGILRTRKRKP